YVWIPMRDGTRLAARVWLPADAESDSVPGILEAVPYRLSDGMATRDVLIHPYWAARGYACVRVDLRGSGESDGVLEDEYHPQEQEDLLEVIAWIAAQPWCTGAVGMTGISWGGFNSLQLAARRPPALKAIITLMSTDDRYADDVHYKGGCVLATDLLHWSTCMLHWQCQPPHEAAVGERWRELWERRLEANEPWIHTWLAHQRRDAYWKHGSVCEDYAAIEIPVYTALNRDRTPVRHACALLVSTFVHRSSSQQKERRGGLGVPPRLRVPPGLGGYRDRTHVLGPRRGALHASRHLFSRLLPRARPRQSCRRRNPSYGTRMVNARDVPAAHNGLPENRARKTCVPFGRRV
ncbi:CocE/NonD family hydrolase, partial [bacterium]|nr:CocE/NonD family hydrolase [bacterium]